MYECWAWVDRLNNEQYSWVKGWDVGTTTMPYRGHVTIFRVQHTDLGYYVDDWQLYYGDEKPDREGEEHVPYTR